MTRTLLPANVAAWLRRYFWLWVAYQTVKGLATTTLVWLPLLYLFLAG